MTPRDGLSSLVAAVAARLPAGAVAIEYKSVSDRAGEIRFGGSCSLSLWKKGLPTVSLSSRGEGEATVLCLSNPALRERDSVNYGCVPLIGASSDKALEFDSVVLAIPATAVSRLLAEIDAPLVQADLSGKD